MSAPLQLTDANYYGIEADRAYMSFSQYKNWLECPARQYAKLFNDWRDPKDEPHALLGGRLFHTLVLEPHKEEEFFKQNPNVAPVPDYSHDDLKSIAKKMKLETRGILSKKEKLRELILAHDPNALPQKERKLRCQYRWVAPAVEAFNNQETFVTMLERGEQETIVTYEFGGVWWKSRLDNVRVDDSQFDDLKGMKDFADQWTFDEESGKNVKAPWYIANGYDKQMAVYRVAAHAAYGKWMRPNIIGVSKEFPPDVTWVQFKDGIALDTIAAQIEMNVPMVQAWKDGSEPAPRCGKCAYCRSTKKVTAPIIGEVA